MYPTFFQRTGAACAPDASNLKEILLARMYHSIKSHRDNPNDHIHRALFYFQLGRSHNILMCYWILDYQRM